MQKTRTVSPLITAASHRLRSEASVCWSMNHCHHNEEQARVRAKDVVEKYFEGFRRSDHDPRSHRAGSAGRVEPELTTEMDEGRRSAVLGRFHAVGKCSGRGNSAARRDIDTMEVLPTWTPSFL